MLWGDSMAFVPALLSYSIPLQVLERQVEELKLQEARRVAHFEQKVRNG